jgi:hypothetical protein
MTKPPDRPTDKPRIVTRNDAPRSTRRTKTISGPSAAPPFVPPTAPLWLAGWTPAYPVPVSLAEVRTQLATFEAACAPSEPLQVVAALSPLLKLFRRSVPEKWAEEIADIYVETLREVPPDLLPKAVRHIIQASRFFPTVAEIIDAIRIEWNARNDCRMTLRTAEMFAARQQVNQGPRLVARLPAPTEDEPA